MSEEGNMEKVKRHAVEIRFDTALKQIVCVPHKLIVRPNDVIVWQSEKGQPFTLDFGWDSPFPETCIAFPARGKDKEVIVPERAPEGLYEYFVALYNPRTGLVHTFDPDLIIRGNK
jgi:hypothetical protein